MLSSSLIILNLNLLACMFVLLFKPFGMFIFDFTDGKCSLYVYPAKDSFLSSFQEKAHDGTLYCSKCTIFILSPFLTISYNISFSSSSFKSLATFIWSMVLYPFTFRVSLTFEKLLPLS